jgi:hypothetical protein
MDYSFGLEGYNNILNSGFAGYHLFTMPGFTVLVRDFVRFLIEKTRELH